MKTELHVHTKCSDDSILPLWLLLAMCRLKHIDCIAVCDHNSTSFGAYKDKLEDKGIRVIIGEEIFSSDGEIIGLFLNEPVPGGLSAEKTVEAIRAQNGLVYIPHPYDEKRKKTVISEKALARISGDVDMIEVHNGRNIDEEYGRRQKELAMKYCGAAAFVCGSDAHTFFEIGRNYVISKDYAANDPAAFREAMLRGENITRRCSPLAHAATKAARVIKMLGNGDINGIIGAVRRRRKKGSKKAG